MIFLCNPNNPTGDCAPVSEIERLAKESDVAVAIDEAYFEFCGKSAIDLTDRLANVVVCRTLSKAFSMAGVRVGYLVAGAETTKSPQLRPTAEQPFGAFAVPRESRSRSSRGDEEEREGYDTGEGETPEEARGYRRNRALSKPGEFHSLQTREGLRGQGPRRAHAQGAGAKEPEQDSGGRELPQDDGRHPGGQRQAGRRARGHAASASGTVNLSAHIGGATRQVQTLEKGEVAIVGGQFLALVLFCYWETTLA